MLPTVSANVRDPSPDPPPLRAHKHASKRQSPSLQPSLGSSKRTDTSDTPPRSNFTSPVNTRNIRNDRLGTLVRKLSEAYASADSWESFVNDFRGPSYLSPTVEDIDHPASELLRTWRDEGVPARTSSEPWTYEQKDRCVARGCHKSAIEHASFLREEMAEFI